MQVKAGRLGARLIGKTWVTTRADVERYRLDHLGRLGRPRKPGGLKGLLAAIGQDLGEAEADVGSRVGQERPARLYDPV
jgi:hypothetical protein